MLGGMTLEAAAWAAVLTYLIILNLHSFCKYFVYCLRARKQHQQLLFVKKTNKQKKKSRYSPDKTLTLE